MGNPTVRKFTPPIAPRRPPPRGTNPYLIPIMLVAGGVLVAQMFWLQKNDYMFRPFALERITCDLCKGLGVVRDRSDEELLRMCPACYGVGSHTIRRIDAEDYLCPACRGMGRVPDDEPQTWRMCRRCEGRGLVREAPWMTTREAFTNAPR